MPDYVSSGYVTQGYVQHVETPYYQVELELAPGVFTDLGGVCHRANFSRTLADVFSPLQPDEALFEFANDVGSLSPLLNSNLMLSRQVKLRVTYGGSAYNLFRGRIKQVAVRPAITERTAVVEAMTEVNRVDRTQIRTGLLVGLGISSLFTEVMTRSAVLSFNSPLSDRVDFAWYQDRNALNAVNDMLTAGPYEMFVDGAGTFQFREREIGVWRNSRSSVGTISEAQDINFTMTDKEVINQVRLSATPRTQISAVSTLAYIGQPVALPASGSINFFLSYYDPRNFGLITPVGSIVALVSSQDYYAAANSDGTGTDRTSTLSVAVTSFAEAALVALFNGTGNISYLSRFQIRGYPILSGAEQVVVTDDSSSQTTFGLSGRTYDDLLIKDINHLNSYSQYLVDAKAQPDQLVALVLKNEIPSMFELDVGKAVSIVNSLTGVNSLWYINRVSHDISMMGGLEHTISLDTDYMRAKNLLNCEGAAFNATSPISSWLTRGKLSGVSDGKKGILSAWLRAGSTDDLVTAAMSSVGLGSGYWQILCPTFAGTSIRITHVPSGAASGAVAIYGQAQVNSWDTNQWHHILMAWDVGISRFDAYADDSKLAFVNSGGVTLVNTTLTYTQSTWQVGHGTTGAALAFRGDIAELYFNTNEYLDPTYVTNRRKFVTNTGRPVNLGAAGATPTGTAPAIYLKLADGATSGGAFAINNGTGGNFTVVGSLGISTTAPSDL